MHLAASLKIALKALAANKLRSALTMLGIIIGVFAVVLLVSTGRGVQQYVSDVFMQAGTNGEGELVEGVHGASMAAGGGCVIGRRGRGV